ncbi:BCNT domain-containing protein, partial [Ascoidea rubescens DSM 1968]
ETSREIKRANYNKIESQTGGLIKTRHQRRLEQLELNGKKFLSVSLDNGHGNENINLIWEQMNKSNSDRSKSLEEAQQNAIGPTKKNNALKDGDNQMIKIKTSYEFAGETISEEKYVNTNSAEAKAYLNSIHSNLNSTSNKNNNNNKTRTFRKSNNENNSNNKESNIKIKKRIKRKRPSIIDAIINNAKLQKINTLEKSRLDWASFVDRNNIDNELKSHNKDGYLSKQDFLHKVELNKDLQYKLANKKLNSLK